MNANPGQGGHYVIDGEGRRVRVESTQDHPEGNGPRPADLPPADGPAAAGVDAHAPASAPSEAHAEAAPAPRSDPKKRS